MPSEHRLYAPEPTTTNKKKPSMMELTEVFSFCRSGGEGGRCEGERVGRNGRTKTSTTFHALV